MFHHPARKAYTSMHGRMVSLRGELREEDAAMPGQLVHKESGASALPLDLAWVGARSAAKLFTLSMSHWAAC